MVLESPQWGGFHPYVSEFESAFAAYQDCRYGISAFNGTVTLELALTVLGIGPGDEVIIPAISFVSTATAVSRVGATPVFVDLEPWSFNIDPQRVREAITSATKCVIGVHFGGPLCNVGALVDICREYDLIFLEDAAHAHGSAWNGRKAGSFGVAGSFSFQNGKVLCSGEGGMLTTSDDSFAELARSVANQGRVAGRSFYEHHNLGSNFRLTAFQAAVLTAQFERLPEQIKRRADSAALIRRELSGCDAIVWQEQARELTQNSWYLMLARIRGGRAMRDRLQEHLSLAGIPSTPFYPHTLYQNPLYTRGNCRVEPCPQAEACLSDAIWLPHRVLLADEDTIRQVAAVIGRTISV
jgi:dTDP-4-amino-4,6-dideoxygalactose transaminase